VTSEEWQALAEIIATIVAVLGLLAGIFLKLLAAFFVTRKEHKDLAGRVDNVEVGMNRTVKKEDLNELNDRLYGVEQKLSGTDANLQRTNGLLQGNIDAAKSLHSQLNILIEAGLDRSRS